MNALGWQIGAVLIGVSALVIAVYVAKLLNTTNKVVEKAYRIADYNERNINEIIDNVASITDSAEDIMNLITKITNISKVFRYTKRKK